MSSLYRESTDSLITNIYTPIQCIINIQHVTSSKYVHVDVHVHCTCRYMYMQVEYCS